MRKLKIIYRSGALLAAIIFMQPLFAQTIQTNPATIELQKAKSLWFNTNNGAGLVLDQMKDFTIVNLGYTTKTGDFKLRQQGTREGDINVGAEGGLTLGGGYVWGKISYDNILQKNTQYNTTMLDPDRGMPYYVADPVISDWVKQSYQLSMKAATPKLWNLLYLGIEADYQTKTGAKQMDPRSKTDYYSIDVRPSVLFNLKEHSIGLNFEYQNNNQESAPTLSNSQQEQIVYLLKGVGNYSSGVVGGLQGISSYVYSGNKLGGGLQYSYTINEYKALLSGNYSYRVEDVITAPSKPKKVGTIKDAFYGGNLQLVKAGKDMHKLEIGYKENKLSGIEYVQVLDNTYEVQQWITVHSSVRSKFTYKEAYGKYDFFRGADTEYNWRVGVDGSYDSSTDTYLLPHSSMHVKNFCAGLNFKYNIPVDKSTRILAGVNGKFNKNIEASYNYNGADPMSLVVTDFMTPDFLYRAQDYYKAGAEATMFFNISKANTSGMFVKVACDYYKPKEGDGNRVVANFGLGFTF